MTLLGVLRFLSLFLTGLGAGVSLSHALQWPRKAMFPGDVFLRVQQDLYANYGAAGGIIEGAAFLSTVGTGYLVRRRPRTRSLVLVASACNLVTILIWATLINPINRRTLGWSTETLPPDWPEVRDRWHALHAARLILSLVGFGALIASVLEDARAATRG